VLKVIEEERLQHHALKTGEYLMQRLRDLQRDFDFLGDVRGLGLMVGIECVTDSASKRHAPVMAAWIRVRRLRSSSTGGHSLALRSSSTLCSAMHTVCARYLLQMARRALVSLPDTLFAHVQGDTVPAGLQERLKARRVLVTTDGPKDNVLKLKPPMVFGRVEVDHLLQELTAILREELPGADKEELLQPWTAPAAVQAEEMHRGGELTGEQQQLVAEAAIKKQRVETHEAVQ